MLKSVIGTIGHQSYKNIISVETYDRNKQFVEAELKKRNLSNLFDHDFKNTLAAGYTSENFKKRNRQIDNKDSSINTPIWISSRS